MPHSLKNYSIEDENGLQVELSNYGARICKIEIQKENTPVQLACHYPQLEDFLDDKYYLGATVGPIANRIAEGKLNIDGKLYELSTNHGIHCLHGGTNSFDQMFWDCVAHDSTSVEFCLNYPENQNSEIKSEKNALPGNLQVRARYSVQGQQLRLCYFAQTDRNTYLNLCNHVYLNLNDDQQNINNHQFELYANAFAEIDNLGIPNGELRPIQNPFNYELASPSGITQFNDKIDHHFIVNEHDQSLKPLAKASSSESGISVLVSSTKPGFQFYSGHFLEQPFAPYDGFCIEPQFAPNAINLKQFFSPLTTPELPYQHSTLYDFSW